MNQQGNRRKAVGQAWRGFMVVCLGWWLLPVLAQGQFVYTTNNGAITVASYTGTGGPTVIPATFNGLPVTTIADGAFDGSAITSLNLSSNITSVADDAFLNCISLTNVVVNSKNTNYSSLAGVLFGAGRGTLVLYPAGIPAAAYTIPDGVTNIGYFAFFDCPSLQRVTIPEGVNALNNFIFFDCTNLGSVTIPGSVASIGNSAFYNVLNLTNITVAAQNTNYSSLSGVLFNQPQTTLILYPPGKPAASYAVPGGVTNIANYAFENCGNLTGVTIPNGLVSIGQQAFSSCTGLAAITIPGSVASIGSDAFVNCTSLAGLIISNGVAGIGQQAFSGCDSLTNVVIPESITNIGDTAFENCASLTNFTVDPQNVYYSSLDGVLFNQSQTTLIQYPPGNLETNYTIPNGVTTVGDYAFYYCEPSSVSIPGSVTNIQQGAFEYCDNLAAIAIPGSVTSIGAYAFFYCTNLTNVVISNGVSSIGVNAFGFCSSLASVIIPGSVTSIGDFAFQACNDLNAAYFEGNAVYDDGTIFSGDTGTVYYLSGATGWGATFSGLPTAIWASSALPPISISGPGLIGKQFGFTILWATNLPVVVEACTNLEKSVWLPIHTNTITGGAAYFNDAASTNYPVRYYRVIQQ